MREHSRSSRAFLHALPPATSLSILGPALLSIHLTLHCGAQVVESPISETWALPSAGPGPMPVANVSNDKVSVSLTALDPLSSSSNASSAGLEPSEGSAPLPRLRSTITVEAGSRAVDRGLPVPYQVLQQDVLSSAGTWGDFSRI
jgi:hypothetical protein